MERQLPENNDAALAWLIQAVRAAVDDPEQLLAVLAQLIRAADDNPEQLLAVLARLQLIPAAVNNPARLLAITGIAAVSRVVREATALPVGGGGYWWLKLLLLGVCFFTGVGAVGASVWVNADADRRRATGRILLAVSVVNLLVALALCGFDPQNALNTFDAML